MAQKLTTLKSRLSTAPSRLATVSSIEGGWRTGKTTAERGYGGRWQRARERFLYDHPLCSMCSELGQVTAATVVDHKVPHRGDQVLFWDESNWAPLCAHHHSSDKQREEKRSV